MMGLEPFVEAGNARLVLLPQHSVQIGKAPVLVAFFLQMSQHADRNSNYLPTDVAMMIGDV